MKFIWHHIRNYLQPSGMVLMYHRVAEPEADIWDIAVRPENFEQQLLALKRNVTVVPLSELTNSVKKKKLKKNSVAITFDDGYIDNFLVAKPLLEKYQLPATFFITSTYLNQEKEFWWDELENLILFSKKLPQTISISKAGNAIQFDLKSEAELNVENAIYNRNWKACEHAPITLRTELFLMLWQQLKTLPYSLQLQELEKLKNWAKNEATNRPEFKSMSVAQLQEFASNDLFEIGAHTASHVALEHHNFRLQKKEMLANKEYLRSITGREINLLAYPYGSYNKDTALAAEAAAFDAAFTTDEKVVTAKSHAYQLGRFQVKNIISRDFENRLKAWKNKQ